MIKKLNGQNFNETLKTNIKPMVVNFSTDWCPYCKRLAPIIEHIADERANEVDVYYVNTDDDEPLSDQYDVMTVPTVFIFKNGEAIASAVNPRTKEAVNDLITKNII